MTADAAAPLPFSEDWWRVALSSIGDGVIVTDGSRQVALMNPLAESLTGWMNTEAKGRASGFQIHVSNPFDPLELIAVVASLAGKTGSAKDK